MNTQLFEFDRRLCWFIFLCLAAQLGCKKPAFWKVTGIDNGQADLFRNRLSSQLDMRDTLIQLSRILPWESYEECFGKHDTEKRGTPAKPIR